MYRADSIRVFGGPVLDWLDKNYQFTFTVGEKDITPKKMIYCGDHWLCIGDSGGYIVDDDFFKGTYLNVWKENKQ